MMVAYVRDANAIIVKLIKNHNKGTLVSTYEILYNYLTAQGLTPRMQIYDNECPTAFKRFLHKGD